MKPTTELQDFAMKNFLNAVSVSLNFFIFTVAGPSSKLIPGVSNSSPQQGCFLVKVNHMY